MPASFHSIKSYSELVNSIEEAGGQRAYSRDTGIPRTTIQYKLNQLRNLPEVTNSVDAESEEENQFLHRPAPEPVHIGRGSGVRRFILSSAQDNTAINEAFLNNLEAYCLYLKTLGSAEILIGGFTYSKKLFTEHAPAYSYYHERVRPYLVTDRMRIDDKIDFCSEMNTRPTAEDPLSGLHTYTRERWGIFPHAKVALRSIPTMKNDPVKIIMTTGTVTMPNYLPMKAGVKASFHHVYGAVLVEIAEDGTFFCRHLLGDEDGSFYDLDTEVKDGKITHGHHITALVPGDVHTFQIDPVCSEALFGIYPLDERTPEDGRIWEESDKFSLLDELMPEHLFLHDVLDFRVRNHHSFNDPHDRFSLFVNGTESVEDELEEVAFFMNYLKKDRPWLGVHVVESNHDQALMRWLKHADYRFDPVNAMFFLKCQLAVYESIKDNNKHFSIFEYLIKETFEWNCDDIEFLREDESFMLGGVEHACHGHRGLNGARGTAQAYTKVKNKVTKGHGHSATIIDGVYEAGTTSKLDLSYNAGPSSWSFSSVIQYSNGKRAIITLNNGRWRI